jgi:transcriptional regulator with XRE-family HTH domain
MKELAMTDEISPTMRGRRLRIELRQLRDESGLTIESVARQLDWSPSKVSRLETGQRGVHPSDVRLLSQVYDIPSERREELIEMARQSRKRSWWHEYREEFPAWLEFYLDYEAEATLVRMFTEERIPGPLQVEGYAREVGPGEMQQVRRGRFAQHGIPPLHVILSEGALRRLVGGVDVMREQLTHLAKIAEVEHVTLQVLPFDAGAHPALGDPFTVLEFADHQAITYHDHQSTGVYLEKKDETERYDRSFRELEKLALTPERTVEFIVGLARDLV